MALPHITNSQAGRNKYEPVYNNLFEVYFTLPEALRDKYGQDEALITEHVKNISGLQTLTKSPELVTQKFMGTDRSYLAAKLGDTFHELSITLTLNLRNATDNYIFKIFKDWNALGYDQATGAKALKVDYVADYLKVSIGNRAGDIYREIVYKDIILAEVSGLDSFDYEAGEPQELSIKFRSDWAQELDA